MTFIAGIPEDHIHTKDYVFSFLECGPIYRAVFTHVDALSTNQIWCMGKRLALAVSPKHLVPYSMNIMTCDYFGYFTEY
jgi:hypothetical protein